MSERFLDNPVPLAGWAGLKRLVRCKLGDHGGTAVHWDSTTDGGVTTWTPTVWCIDCGRPLKPTERARCECCGQKTSYHRAPRERQGVEW